MGDNPAHITTCTTTNPTRTDLRGEQLVWARL